MSESNNKENDVSPEETKTTKKEKVKKILDDTLECIDMGFNFFWGIVRPFFTNIFEILEEGRVSQRAAVWVGIGLTIYCLQWVFGFVTNPPSVYTGLDVAAIIGALLAPIAGLTGALMKYGESLHTNNKKDKQE